jgi:hypothetical protein
MCVKARVRFGNQWTALNEAFFQADARPFDRDDVQIRLHSVESAHGPGLYIEVLNSSSHAVNLRGARFSPSVHYTFPTDRDMVLAPGQKATLVKNLLAFRQAHSLDEPVAGLFLGKPRKGEHLTLFAPNQAD